MTAKRMVSLFGMLGRKGQEGGPVSPMEPKEQTNGLAHLNARVDRTLYVALRQLLLEEGMTVTEWAESAAREYLKARGRSVPGDAEDGNGS